MTEENEELLLDNYEKIIPSRTDGGDKFEVFDRLEALIGDDTFAAFLNFNGEILVGEDIYKYTDVGLFIVNEQNYDDLTDLLVTKEISPTPAVETGPMIIDDFINGVPCGPAGLGFSNNIQYAPTSSVVIDCEPQQSVPTGNGPYNPSSGSPAATDPSFGTFVSKLKNCDFDSHGLWYDLVGGLFGDNHYCTDHYQEKRRVKTKAFNFNYVLVYHMGVKVKHQFKGWTGFWRMEREDEIRLVVEAAQWEYDVDQLLNNALIHNNSVEQIYNTTNQRIIYGPNNININGFTFTNLTSLPPSFQSDLSFEFFGTGWTALDNLIQDGIDSNLNAKKLNEYFYDALYNTAKSQLSSAFGSPYNLPNNRIFAAKYPENGKVILQRAYVKKGFNEAEKSKTFDWGAGISMSINENSSGGYNISGGGTTENILPKHFRVKIIGAARGGSNWHGSKFSVGIQN